MKTLKSISALLLLLSTSVAIAADAVPADTKAATPAAAPPTFKAHVLTRAELDALLAKPEQLLIIDVRRPGELVDKGQFPVFLSIQAKDLEKSLAYIPKDRTIVTISNHAGRAGKSADLLADHGFKVAGAAGTEGYEAEGGTVLRLLPPAPKTADATPSAK